MRMSRTVALTSDSESRPLPRRFLKVAVSRSDRHVEHAARLTARPDRRAACGRAPQPTVCRALSPHRPTPLRRSHNRTALDRTEGQAPSQVSMIIATAWATRAGARRPPPNSVT